MKRSKVGWLVGCTGCETITFKVSRVTLQLKSDHEPQNFKTFISAFFNQKNVGFFAKGKFLLFLIKKMLVFLQRGKVHGK